MIGIPISPNISFDFNIKIAVERGIKSLSRMMLLQMFCHLIYYIELENRMVFWSMITAAFSGIILGKKNTLIATKSEAKKKSGSNRNRLLCKLNQHLIATFIELSRTKLVSRGRMAGRTRNAPLFLAVRVAIEIRAAHRDKMHVDTLSETNSRLNVS